LKVGSLTISGTVPINIASVIFKAEERETS
jgi:hypothetical protein